ncbi:MAG TPA: DUF1351 domain-containing protein [Selenomonadales bacterium]|nr:DUF1351 domain-containing protein [Selenomonadales bacterium]
MAKRTKTAELTATVQAMTDSAIAAGLDVPPMPETVIDTPEPVAKTAEIVTETAETVPEKLPLAIDLEPKMLKLVQEFDWNFAEIKTALAGKVERYAGLVVTEDNLTDMEKAQREIASLRVKIGKFRLQIKRELEKPYEKFELQIKELVGLVEDVERPLKDQLEVYENKRRDAKSSEVQAIIDEIANQVGLEAKYTSQIVIADKWLNRGTAKKEITDEIQMRVAWFLDIQNQEHQAEFFRAQKAEMAKLLCQSLSAGLATPLTYEEVEPRIEAMNDILAVKAYIEGEVARRKELEAKAAAAARDIRAVLVGEPLLSEPEEPDYRPGIEYAPDYVPDWPVEPIPMPPPARPLNPPLPPAAAVERWDCDLHIYAVTVAQMEQLKARMQSIGIQYNITGHQRV